MDDRTPARTKSSQGPLSASVAFSKDGLMVRDQQTIDDWTRNQKTGKGDEVVLGATGEDVRATGCCP